MIFTLKKVAIPLVVAGSLLLAACKPGEQDPNHIPNFSAIKITYSGDNNVYKESILIKRFIDSQRESACSYGYREKNHH